MKKMLSLLLAAFLLIHLTGCHLYKPTFEDFSEYLDSFIVVRDYILATLPTLGNDNSSSDYLLTVHLNEEILSISSNKPIYGSELLAAVKELNEKGFSFVNVELDYMIFWEDETRYYGVLWSSDPKSAIKAINEPPMNVKARKLEKEWYEVGALDSI